MPIVPNARVGLVNSPQVLTRDDGLGPCCCVSSVTTSRLTDVLLIFHYFNRSLYQLRYLLHLDGYRLLAKLKAAGKFRGVGCSSGLLTSLRVLLHDPVALLVVAGSSAVFSSCNAAFSGFLKSMEGGLEEV